jgi:putative oxidoreductase
MDASQPLRHAQRAYGWLIAAAALLQSPLLLALRLYFGWQFFLAGKGKLEDLAKPAGYFRDLGIPWPEFNAVLAGSTECFGGLLLLAGLASRLVSLPLAFTMLVAYLTAEREALFAIFSDPDRFLASAPLPFLLAVLVVLAFGPGVFSLDWLIARKLKSKTESAAHH